jgi:hemolysin activation/secretion protein
MSSKPTILLIMLMIIVCMPSHHECQQAPSPQTIINTQIDQSINQDQKKYQDAEMLKLQDIQLKSTPPRDLDPFQLNTDIPTNAPKWTFTDIHLKKNTIIPKRTLNKIITPYLNRPISAIEIENITKQLTNIYISRGYVTSRVTVAEQDLKSGTLQLIALEGYIRHIITKDPNPLWTAFPDAPNHLLNIYTLDQGIDQINRLGSLKATLTITPSHLPLMSDVSVDITRYRPFHVSIKYDNTSDIGFIPSSISLTRDDLIGKFDRLSLDYFPDYLGDNTQHSGRIAYELPLGHLTLKASHQHLSYTKVYKGNTFIYYSGETTTSTAGLDYLFHRNARTKHSVSTDLQFKDSKAFIADTPLLSQQYSHKALSAGYAITHSLNKGMLRAEYQYQVNLPYWGAYKGDPSEHDVYRYQKHTLTTYASYWTTPFGRPLQLSQSSSLQYAHTPLPPFERMHLGDRYTLRGLDPGFLNGDTGGYIQHALTLPIGKFAWTLGIDTGTTQNDDQKTWKSASTASLTLRYTSPNYHCQLTYGTPFFRDSFKDTGNGQLYASLTAIF